jgi:HD-GYP domain-containing protein (c-di-GMP phosphodiesterase class II)
VTETALAVRFAAFVEDVARVLLDPLGDALRAPLAVVDAQGTPLAGGLPSAEGPPHGAPVVLDGVELGRVRVGEATLIPLAESLAHDLARRFETELALDDLTDQLGQCYDELNLLYRLSRSRRPAADLGTTCRMLLAETASLLDSRRLLLHLPATGRAVTHFEPGPRATPSPSIESLARSPEDLTRLHRDLVAGIDEGGSVAERHQGRVDGALPGVVHTIVPVRIRERVAGFVGVLHHEHEPAIQSGELRMLECLAAQVSSAATTGDLRRELEDVLFNTVKCLVAAIDAKDPYTKGHSQRVYQLAMSIAQRLGLSRPILQTLTWSALLHDVGKIAIPLRILAKPTKLTPEEYDIVKTHPVRGCLVLEPIPQLRSVLPGIRHHHERWDGLGYPDGLAGHDIPLIARIIAVADTYDAMVTTRAYRTARTHHAAVAEICDSAGTQLDPDIVDAFLELEAEGTVAPEVGPIPGAA